MSSPSSPSSPSAPDDQARTPVDPTRCPLCGESNACGVASGKETCWCFSTRIPDDVLEQIPPEKRDLACVCERCASRLSEINAGAR